MELDLKKEVTQDVSKPSVIIEFAIEEILKTFKEVGGMQPLITLECDDDEDLLRGLPLPPEAWASAERKAITGDLIRGFVYMMMQDNHKPALVFSAMEAWQSPPIDPKDMEETMKNPPVVEDMEDRKEVLIFNLETKTQNRSITYEVIRGEGESFVVSKEPIHDEVSEKIAGEGIISTFQVWHIDNDGNPQIGHTPFKLSNPSEG